MTHEEKLTWMQNWAWKNNVRLELAGECGICRDCVGIIRHDSYPDYDEMEDIWVPEDAYHKHSCVAVLGRGKGPEAQLYDWLKWFDDNGYSVYCRSISPEEEGKKAWDMLDVALGQNINVKMEKR